MGGLAEPGTEGQIGRRAVAWFTPSPIRGPLLALTSSVYRVSMTSSFSDGPPHVSWERPWSVGSLNRLEDTEAEPPT